MNLPSTEELQRLLDKATPGPWCLHEDETGDPDGTYLYDVKGVMCIAITPIGSGSDYREDDLDLAALAPVLAAEVIRLRQGINDLKKAHVDALNNPVGDGSLYFHSNAIFELSRILEGDQT